MDNFGENKKIVAKRKVWPWIVGGFASVFIAFGLFYFGLMVGSGQVSLSFGRGAVKDNQGLPNRLNYDSVDQVYKTLKQKFDGQLDEEKLMLGLKKGLVDAAGDQHTTYLDSSEAKELSESLNGSFTGIGAELGKDGEYITIVAPISGFPADKAGIRAKDVIVSINGEDAIGMDVDKAVSKIRGEKGTTVKLVIVRDKQKLNFDIVRDTIKIDSVESKILDRKSVV